MLPSGEWHGNGGATKSFGRCRRCRVDGRCLSLRLTDGALSSDIFPRDYHQLAGAGGPHDDRRPAHLLPVKWMAVETLNTTDDDRQLSTANDVVRDHCRRSSHFRMKMYIRHNDNGSVGSATGTEGRTNAGPLLLFDKVAICRTVFMSSLRHSTMSAKSLCF